MATVKEMKATARPKSGKGAARNSRRTGKVPGVIYGDSKPPVLVLIEHDDLKQRIYAGRFLTTLYDLDVEGTKHRVIPRDFQLDALKDLPMHVDFMRVAEGATIRVKIPIHVLNADQSPGVKRGGAVNIVSKRPDLSEAGGWAKVGYDSDLEHVEKVTAEAKASRFMLLPRRANLERPRRTPMAPRS